MDFSGTDHRSHAASELYFLIAKFLSGGPCKKTLEVLKEELEQNNLLPSKFDWQGNEFNQSFNQLSVKYPHIGPDHLLEICRRICPILDREYPPSVPGIFSLLGASRQSLLRISSVPHSVPLRRYSARHNGVPYCDPSDFHSVHHIVRILEGRRNSGPFTRKQVIPAKLYCHMQLHNRTLGHLSAVYCLLFDRTGQFVFTGADDLLVKVWSTQSGRLLATLRGASSEITDMAVNVENTLLAAGSLDRVLRVWCLQSTAPVAVLLGHTGMITGVNFCPGAIGDVRYLTSTSTDGSVAFWVYNHHPIGHETVFQTRPIIYNEKMRPGGAQMICSSFSPGGTFLAAGSGDHHVRIYAMHGEEGPTRVYEIEAHSDRVDSIQWANKGLRFVSGSKDGTAIVWQFKRQKWAHLRLEMTTKLPGTQSTEEDGKVKPKVSMVCWDRSDKYVVTAVNDASFKVWDSYSGRLIHILKAHKDEVFVLEAHPFDSDIMLSAGHDGLICIWDITRGIDLMQHQNTIDGQGHGAVFDAKWSPDGTMFAATDSHGHILVFGFGSGSEKLKKLPRELFFHTDYRPLIRDANLGVLDEQTQTAPHLMPPPFLVDVDGCPYPPDMQKLVPGREECKIEQLVPNVAFGVEGQQEVLEGLPSEPPRSNIDHMIQALVNRQYGQANSRQPLIGTRTIRQRDAEGVRFSSGDWESGSCMTWKARTMLKPIDPRILEQTRLKLDATAAAELEEYDRELKLQEETPPKPVVDVRPKRKTRRKVGAYQTRAAREENVLENAENISLSASTSTSSMSDSFGNSDLGSESDSDENSEYSDWIADHGVSLEPPKRSRRKRVPRKISPSPSPPPRRKNKDTKESNSPMTSTVAVGEVPFEFQPPKWLSEVVPRKAPYYPQMGDEVMFFYQGYTYYLDAVRAKQVYKMAGRQGLKLKLSEPTLVKVVGIKYEIRPPRLCCLRLAVLNDSGSLTDSRQFFNIKYHDMPDVIDFLVLKQTYDTAIQRNWKPGDRFRCMIEDSWWEGKIVARRPHDPDVPDSPFLSFLTRWDNGEDEPMSPWDMEPPDPSHPPLEPGASVPVLPEETQALLYSPRSDEWPNGDRDATCRRIIAGLNKVMNLAIAEPFIAPVDLNHYPTYALSVEYPIDLSTIKARLENRFYRRLTAVQFDVRYLATNAEKFNEAHSQIVKHARIVSDLCLRIISDRIETDVGAVYHQLTDTYHSSPSEGESDTNDLDRPGPSNRKVSFDWKVACERLLREMWDRSDSFPFRQPVDITEHPDYLKVIDSPMDLGTVKEELEAGNYSSPRDFYKDVRLIFANSKNYNTNKRSRIFSMTVRLSNMFEDRMKQIMLQWKATRRKMVLDELRLRKLKLQKKKLDQPGPSNMNGASDTDIESEDPVDEHLKLSTLRNNYLKQNEAQLNGHSYAKSNHNATTNSRESSKRRSRETDSGSSSSEESSGDTYKPNGKLRTRNRGKQNVRYNDQSCESSNSSDDSDDDSPLIRRGTKRQRAHNRSDNSETSTIRQTRSSKIRRRNGLESDSPDSDSDSEQIEESSNSGVGAPSYTVSSRGRVRKLTERARALLNKD
ncbi:hypothetical protein RUM43_010358 [Polyplax serrata]|uniref:Bromo domain-containing protein n=1 Tax=Polyplax serrata TaxID=468196 RepID=A0AAN8PKF6_POLSC